MLCQSIITAGDTRSHKERECPARNDRRPYGADPRVKKEERGGTPDDPIGDVGGEQE